MARPQSATRYAAIIEEIFRLRHQPGQRSVEFERDDIERTVLKALELNRRRWSAGR